MLQLLLEQLPFCRRSVLSSFRRKPESTLRVKPAHRSNRPKKKPCHPTIPPDSHPSDYSSVPNWAVPLQPPFRRLQPSFWRLQPSFRRKPESALRGKTVHRPNHPKETLHPTTPPIPPDQTCQVKQTAFSFGQLPPSETGSVSNRPVPAPNCPKRNPAIKLSRRAKPAG